MADDRELAAQLRQPKLADVVAGALRARIVNGELADGARLPKQDELLREFKVSRPPLREALRILEAEGLVAVQRGNVGGSIVRAPNAQSSAYMFGLVLQSRQVSLGDLAEAIRNVEPLAAGLCARRKDRRRTVVPQLRKTLKESVAAVEDEVQFTATARHFHESLVQGCGNQTLILMLGSLELMWSQQEQQWARRAHDQDSYPTRAERNQVLAVHRAILVAIEQGEDESAARLATAHLNESQLYTLSGGKDAVVQAATWNGASAGNGTGPGSKELGYS